MVHGIEVQQGQPEEGLVFLAAGKALREWEEITTQQLAMFIRRFVLEKALDDANWRRCDTEYQVPHGNTMSIRTSGVSQNMYLPLDLYLPPSVDINSIFRSTPVLGVSAGYQLGQSRPS